MVTFDKLSNVQLQHRLGALQESLDRQPSTVDTPRILEDLQIHQIELELQNRELREAQQQLEQARDRYADLYDFAPVSYLSLGRTGKIKEINLTGAGMLGRERLRLIGMPLATFLAPGESLHFFRHLKDVFEKSGKFVTQVRLQPGLGAALDVVLESIAFESGAQGSRCRTAIIDITARHQAEEALRRAHDDLEKTVRARTAELAKANSTLRANEARLAHAQALAQVGSWELNLETGEQTWSDEAARMFGFEPDELITDPKVYLNALHPDDHERFNERLRNALVTGHSPEFEFRIMRPNNEQRIIRSRGDVIFSQDGRPIKAIGTGQDITERKRAEEGLRQAAAVFDNTNQGIVVIAANGDIVAVNSAFTSITGYQANDVLGRNPQILRSDRHDKAFYRTVWRSLKKQGHWQGEVWSRHKDGHTQPIWGNVSLVLDEHGVLTNYVAVFSDISPIKEAQERLQYLAHHDSLTGVPNRLLFDARLEHALQRAKRYGHRVGLLCFDLDHFKVINDTLGHKAGDVVLRTIAQRLRDSIRADDTVARMGGDEFVIILDEIARPEDAGLLADKMQLLVADPVSIQHHEIVTSASIGISIYPDDAQDSQSLCQTADAALYLAKQRGRANYQFYSTNLTAKQTDTP